MVNASDDSLRSRHHGRAREQDQAFYTTFPMFAAGYIVQVHDWQIDSVVTNVRGLSPVRLSRKPGAGHRVVEHEVMDLRANSCHGVVLR